MTRPRALAIVAVCAGLALLAWATRTRYPFAWDSVNFALAIEEIDLVQHRPHPPGHFGYVLVGRVLKAVTADENAALVLWTVIASALAAALSVVLALWAAARVPWRTAAYTLLLLASSVSFAFYQRVAEIYMSDLMFTTAFALAAVALVRGRRWSPAAAGSLLALAGWFKLSLIALLLPAAVYAGWLASARHRWTLAGAFAVTAACWLVPTLAAVGPRVYVRTAYAQVTESTAGTRIDSRRPLRALNRNVRDSLRFALLTFGTGGVFAVMLQARRRRRPSWPRETSRLFLALTLPFFALAILVHVPKPGYLLPVLGIGSLYIAQLFAQHETAGRWLLACAVATASLHFWMGTPVSPARTGGSKPYRSKSVVEKGLTETSAFMDFTYAALRSADAGVEWLSDVVHRDCATSDRALLVGRDDQLNWRRVMYAFPGATTVALIPDEALVVSRARRSRGVAPGETVRITAPCAPLFVAVAGEFERGWPVPRERVRMVGTHGVHGVATIDGGPLQVSAGGASARIVWGE